MTVDELIAELQKLSAEGQGAVPVVVFHVPITVGVCGDYEDVVSVEADEIGYGLNKRRVITVTNAGSV